MATYGKEELLRVLGGPRIPPSALGAEHGVTQFLGGDDLGDYYMEAIYLEQSNVRYSRWVLWVTRVDIHRGDRIAWRELWDPSPDSRMKADMGKDIGPEWRRRARRTYTRWVHGYRSGGTDGPLPPCPLGRKSSSV